MTTERTVELKVTTGMNLSIERYNALLRAEPYLRLVEEGWVDLWLVSYENSIRVTVPNSTTLAQIYTAAAALMPVPKKMVVRDHTGMLLELGRRVGEFRFSYGERLFVG
jgi:hypothetical protein